MEKIWVRPLGRGDPLEKAVATHSSILAWKIPWTEETSSPWSHKKVEHYLITKQQQHSLFLLSNWGNLSKYNSKYNNKGVVRLITTLMASHFSQSQVKIWKMPDMPYRSILTLSPILSFFDVISCNSPFCWWIPSKHNGLFASPQASLICSHLRVFAHEVSSLGVFSPRISAQLTPSPSSHLWPKLLHWFLSFLFKMSTLDLFYPAHLVLFLFFYSPQPLSLTCHTFLLFVSLPSCSLPYDSDSWRTRNSVLFTFLPPALGIVLCI